MLVMAHRVHDVAALQLRSLSYIPGHFIHGRDSDGVEILSPLHRGVTVKAGRIKNPNRHRE
jgi:hypothetical protein